MLIFDDHIDLFPIRFYLQPNCSRWKWIKLANHVSVLERFEKSSCSVNPFDFTGLFLHPLKTRDSTWKHLGKYIPSNPPTSPNAACSANLSSKFPKASSEIGAFCTWTSTSADEKAPNVSTQETKTVIFPGGNWVVDIVSTCEVNNTTRSAVLYPNI